MYTFPKQLHSSMECDCSYNKDFNHFPLCYCHHEKMWWYKGDEINLKAQRHGEV
jgi:hypothetical protein